MLVQKGRLEEAARLLREQLAREPDDHRARQQLIRTLALSGDMSAVKREVDAFATRVGPRDPRPWIELGHAFEIGHSYEEALAAYDRAAQIAPKDPLGPRTGGMRAARWGEAELAKPRLEEALRRDARDAEVWHALGLVRLRLGDSAGAELAYRSGLAADPTALENRVGLATVALLRKDDEAALREYDAILAQRPRFADAQLGRAYALLRLGRLEDAELAVAAAERGGASPGVIRRQRSLLQRLKSRQKPQTNR